MKINEEQMADLRRYLTQIYDLCDKASANGVTVQAGGENLTVRQLFEIEMTAYLFYLTAADGEVTEEEIAFINGLMARDYSLEDCAAFIRNVKMMDEDFGKRTPVSFKMLVDFSHEIDADASDVLISFYDTLGRCVIEADDMLLPAEEEAQRGYVYLLRGYKALREGD